MKNNEDIINRIKILRKEINNISNEFTKMFSKKSVNIDEIPEAYRVRCAYLFEEFQGYFNEIKYLSKVADITVESLLPDLKRLVKLQEKLCDITMYENENKIKNKETEFGE